MERRTMTLAPASIAAYSVYARSGNTSSEHLDYNNPNRSDQAGCNDPQRHITPQRRLLTSQSCLSLLLMQILADPNHRHKPLSSSDVWHSQSVLNTWPRSFD